MLKIKKTYCFVTKKFDELKIGDTFKVNDEFDSTDLYIKTKSGYKDKNGVLFNSVNLTNGFYYYFLDCDNVKEVNIICDIEYV